MAAKSQTVEDVDVVVVGAGFAGMYLLVRLRAAGMTAVAVEAGDGVGGTWYWNRYPGARCDVESLQYSYQFDDDLQQEWSWSERFSAQPEILEYANHVADRHDLRRDIRFNWRVKSAAYAEDSATWLLTAEDGRRVRGRFCVMATGCLSVPNW
ncbi:MAG: NAD(P)/FAD-dependent oxidoreductase, partial [Pseudomonadota bacterium]|nr:NAD(P)/FAD-dependent oxidoreductase [Pseudomonadota bacterium]